MKAKVFHLQVIAWLIFISLFITVSKLQAQNLDEVKIKTATVNVSFEQALKFIEQNTKFSFTYNKKTLPLDLKVKLTNGETSLYDLLYNLAKSTGVTFHRISNQIVIKKGDGKEKILVMDEANNTIEGKVIDAKTNEPLAFVSVYLSGTTLGTTTNIKGIYRIKSIPQGKYNLVASIVSYESRIVEIDLNNQVTLTQDFSLDQKVYKFNQIDVSGEIPQKWREQLKYFKKLFLGSNEFADGCSIKNEYNINFYEDGSSFKAEVNAPLILLNNALGYKVECELRQFVYDKRKLKLSYVAYPKFSEIVPLTKDSLEEFKTKRKNAYFGSLTHLLRCLSKQDTEFKEENFELTYLYGRQSRLSPVGPVLTAKELVIADTSLNEYNLNTRDGSQLRYRTRCAGLKIEYSTSYKVSVSYLYLSEMGANFDSGGYFIYPNEYSLRGDMAKEEGMAMMLPRFWNPEMEE